MTFSRPQRRGVRLAPLAARARPRALDSLCEFVPHYVDLVPHWRSLMLRLHDTPGLATAGSLLDKSHLAQPPCR
jgi:hypothetical protein